MFGITPKPGTKLALAVPLFLVCLFVGVTALFAAEYQDIDSNTKNIYAQSAENTSSEGSVVDFLFSLVTPNNACATAPSPTCNCMCHGTTGVEGGFCCVSVTGACNICYEVFTVCPK